MRLLVFVLGLLPQGARSMNPCKDTSRYRPDADPNVGGATCSQMLDTLQTFTPSLHTCSENVDFGGQMRTRFEVVYHMAPCCEMSPDVCSDYATKVCQDNSMFTPTLDAGVGGANCFSMTTPGLGLSPFNASTQACEQSISISGNNMPRAYVTNLLARSCCTGTLDVCAAWTTIGSSANVSGGSNTLPSDAPCTDANYDAWDNLHCRPDLVQWSTHGCEKYTSLESQESICNGVSLQHVEAVCGSNGCKVLVGSGIAGRTCSDYCSGYGLQCVGAWDEEDDNCAVRRDMTCSETVVDTSDVICECDGVPSITSTTQAPRTTDATACKEMFTDFLRCKAPCAITAATAHNARMPGWINILKTISADMAPGDKCTRISQAQVDKLNGMGFEPASCQ